MPWFKGNLHTHTIRSDGDSSPDDVVQLYAKSGYDWLAISDHNLGFPEEDAQRLTDKYSILVIPANEVGGTGHVVGLGITGQTDRTEFDISDVYQSLQRGVDWVRDQGGIPVLAHPNWQSKKYASRWDGTTMASIRDCNLFEIYNASPDCNTFAAGGEPGTDDIWDSGLCQGAHFFGVGSDDAHVFRNDSYENPLKFGLPKQGWTFVECEILNQQSILKSLEAGRCIAASSSAHPIRMDIANGKYIVEFKDQYPHFHFTTSFIGPDGILSQCHGNRAEYSLSGVSKWVRARVFCSSGKYLWLQPIWL